MAHAHVRCDQCGQVDDHPKWHTSRVVPGPHTSETESYHHDCAPVWLLDQHPADHVVHQVVAAARKGKRGPDLRAHIQRLHETKD